MHHFPPSYRDTRELTWMCTYYELINVYEVLDFVSDEAIEDAWCVSSYLADADLLLAALRGKMSVHNNKTEDVLQSLGASVAVRGVLYGNKQPWSSRFLMIN